jgi:purine-binding chemotaxis protein CheW
MTSLGLADLSESWKTEFENLNIYTFLNLKTEIAMANETAKQSKSYLSFKVGGELFAAHVSSVLNILEMTKITKVPRAPEYMLGVINLRGSVLPVIDTRIKFGMPVTEQTDDTCIIVTEIDMDNETVRVGALVDSVEEVLEMEKENIMPPPSIGNKFETDFIKGVMNINEQFIMVLDMNKVFSTDEITSLTSNQNQSSANAQESSEQTGSGDESANLNAMSGKDEQVNENQTVN